MTDEAMMELIQMALTTTAAATPASPHSQRLFNLAATKEIKMTNATATQNSQISTLHLPNSPYIAPKCNTVR